MVITQEYEGSHQPGSGPARAGKCGQVQPDDPFSRAAVRGPARMTVSSAVSPRLRQLAGGASHRRGAPLADLPAVRGARVRWPAARSLPA
jgi:hypothetical protein